MADPIRILQHRKQKLLNKKESLSDSRWKYEYAKRVKEIDCLIENFFNREWSDGDFDTGEKQCFIPDVVGQSEQLLAFKEWERDKCRLPLDAEPKEIVEQYLSQ